MPDLVDSYYADPVAADRDDVRSRTSSDAGPRRECGAAPTSNRQQLRLGYLVPEFPGQTHAFFWREIVALRSLGVDVHLVSTRRPPLDACRHAFAADAQRETHYLLPFRARHMLAALRSVGSMGASVAYVAGLKETTRWRRAALLGMIPIAAELKSWAQRNGIQHIHAHSCATAAHLAALCRLVGGPSYSLTLHGSLSVYGSDHASKMKHAAFVSTVTRPLQAEVRDCTGWNDDRVPVVTMGIDASRYPARVARELNGPLKITTVGRLCPTKGHRYVLEAMAKLRQDGTSVRYTIAGSGPHQATIERDIEELGLQDFVRLVGSISEDAVSLLLSESDAFVLASIGQGEAAPVAVMEAMAAGLPVICSRIGGTPDMIRDGADGFLVEQRDVEAIVRVLSELTRSTERRASVGSAARIASARFDSRATARQLLSAICDTA
jgi:colanic acid/amylovoran biosynthesis glycosyltransferase